MFHKRLVACSFLLGGLLFGGMACKKGSKESGLPSPAEILHSMGVREKAMALFSLQVQTEEAGVAVEHTLYVRAPSFVRADVRQPQRLSLSFDGHKYYLLEEATQRLLVLHLSLPTVERNLAASMLMGAFVPEGFQLPQLKPQGLKRSWLEPQGLSRVLRLENHLSEGGEAASIAYVVRWPSLDFLKKEVWVEGQPPVVFAMEEEQCIAEHKLCLPTRIVASQQGEALAPQNIKLLSFGEAASNEHFVLQAPEGFTVEQHSLSSLKELEPFLQRMGF